MSVDVSRSGAVALLTLDDPPVNALSDDLLSELEGAIAILAADDEVRAVVLTGAGKKAFAAGAKLDELAAVMNDPEAIADHTALTRRVLGAIEALPQPVVAAVQAAAVGGGLEVALACDLIVVDARAKLGLPEVGLGLIPGAGGTQRLPRRIGAGRAIPMLMLGELLSAEEAQAIGLSNRVAPTGKALQIGLELAEQLATRPAQAVRALKRAVRGGAELSVKDGLDLERAEFGAILGTPDAAEGVAAFIERRPAQFSHR
jgi:enoyl-CoA hydratase